MHIGQTKKEALCPLCCEATIKKNTSYGFEGAHIVADAYFCGTANKYAFYPTCKSCNGHMNTICLFDYLFAKGYIRKMNEICWTIFTCYANEHEEEMQKYDGMMWRFIHHFYGSDRYKAGGGIVNERGIYELLRNYQVTMTVQKMHKYNKKLQDASNMVGLLLQCDITKWDLFFNKK